MPKRSSDDLDTEHTDELPVLHETVALGREVKPLLVTPRDEDTNEHTAMYVAGSEPDDGSRELLSELAARAEQIPALEAQIRVLTDNTRELEQSAAAKDQLIAELEGSLAALRRSADEAAAAERRAAAQLAVRDGRLAELTAAAERLREEAAERSTELAELRSRADSARTESEALRAQLAAKATPAQPVAALDGLREENAALAAYIAGRRRWWDELHATQANLTARVAALTSELAARDNRLAAADALAARESQRAIALRAELVDQARRAESLERELKLARTGEPTTPSASSAGAAAVSEPLDDSAALKPAAADDAAGGEVSPPVLTDAVVGAALPAVEAVAQLEAEVEYKRQQVAAQLVELRDRDQRLRAATSELERARRDLGALRAELEESRGTVARLERAVIDKDRALEARDARIATLHEELDSRLAAGERRELPLAAIDAAALPRVAQDQAADGASAPTLLCLTGDAPKRFALTKKTITVGRGPQCDLQILTHFVSREHARLVSSDGITLIEDLGSRNGVFVNSVRVDRRHLRQGDLVTIGETQFRFVESMAH